MMYSSKVRRLSPEEKALEACRSHKEAERQRRERINGHIATLRALLLPNLNKTDKASVLKEVVRQVRELKKATSELTNDRNDVDGFKSCLFPGDIDEVKLCRSENDTSTLIATLCCEERPDLIMDLTRALNSVKAKVVRAETSTIGGRTKTVLWVRGVSGAGGIGGGPEGLLKRALKVVVDKPCSSSRMGYGFLGGKMHYPY
ncbi:transcription factor bHLH30-like isoform X2 [Silene latifolia]|uniref:transcription factor bHLH30-like isoform X2 n=2 Tax=Silene latifolia TaxID=37657 RepID=UPI003D7840CF